MTSLLSLSIVIGRWIPSFPPADGVVFAADADAADAPTHHSPDAAGGARSDLLHWRQKYLRRRLEGMSEGDARASCTQSVSQLAATAADAAACCGMQYRPETSPAARPPALARVGREIDHKFVG